MYGDFEDDDTDASGERVGGSRLQAVISVNGSIMTKLLPASGEIAIGRSTACDIRINDASISRRHATLRMSPLEIVDEGSRNGTRVRGKTIPSGVATPISVSDAIHVGEAAILLQRVTARARRPAEQPDIDVPTPAVEAECARSARTGAPFAVAYAVIDAGDPREAHRLLRARLRTSDTIKSDGPNGLQLLLLDTRGQDVGLTVARLVDLLHAKNIRARFGFARYPHDGVAAEQLIAHAYAHVDRDPEAPPTAMDRIREVVAQVAEGDLSVLIHGETGAGKELCAEQIHRLSPRASGPFIKFNCSALVESLIESELFGHERGAFTGADRASPGLLETGNGGTVFLDEVGELPLGVQAKLLRVIEERIVRRVGATAGKKIDVRFVFATNRDLLDEVEEGRFRRDLYYRINGVTVAIPPLRERTREIVPLARAFAARVRAGATIEFGSDVVAALEQHSWPGNVRELRNTIERAVLLSSGGAIRPTHLVLARDTPRDSALRFRDSAANVRESQPTVPMERISSRGIATTEPPPMRPSAQSLADEVADLEKQRILQALEECGGNQSRAAKLLGMSRNTLLSRLDDYGLPRPRKP